MLFPIIIFLILFVSLPVYAENPAATAYETILLLEEQKTQKEQENKEIKNNAAASYDDFLRFSGSEEAQSIKNQAQNLVNDYQEASIQNNSKMRQIFEKGTIVGGISNQVFAENEEFRRKQLNLEKEDQLYIFVSSSMPQSLLREYALDAAYTSAVLVMRGVKKEETLDSFFRSELVHDLKPEGAGAMIQLDPRLFDAFQITTVPSIVFTNSSLADLCASAGSTSTYCEPVPSSSYYKIAGAVTLKYALDKFIEIGADAHRFLDNLKSMEVVYEDKDALGVSSETYQRLLANISKNFTNDENTSNFAFEQGTHILKNKKLFTPFGTIDAPEGTFQLLKKFSQ